MIDFYKRNFGLREPYQVIGESWIDFTSPKLVKLCNLVDGTFSQAALKGKIQLKEQLPKYFGGGDVKLGMQHRT